MCEDGLYLEAELGGIEVNCLIDTGAKRSILHPMKCFSIPLNKKPPLSRNILLTNGDMIRILGQVFLPLDSQIGSFTQSFIIAETNEPVILGNDFVSSYGCKIDVANSCLHINGDSMSCVLESKIDSLFRLRLVEDIEVPANSEIILPGYVPQRKGCALPESLFVESTEKCFSKGVVLARILVNTKCDFVSARAMNVSDTPVKFYTETILGDYSVVQDVKPVSVVDEVSFDKNLAEDQMDQHCPYHSMLNQFIRLGLRV